MSRRIPSLSRLIVLALFFADPTFAAEPVSLVECARIADNGQRLACYDRLAQQAASVPPQQALPEPSPPSVAEVARVLESEPFSLAKHWELDQAHKRGTFSFRPHNANYALAVNLNRDPNMEPFEPYTKDDETLSHTELSYQLSFKLKLLEDVFRGSDLWFGYTQRSFWQAYNSRASSPFRDTNYQPELMYVVPVEAAFLGMRARFLNFGLVHQSNGQAATLSRSWNRLYAQAGLERGRFNVLARVWYRLPESRVQDDNRDITDYMGHGDVVMNYRWGDHDFSALLRRNFRTDRGAVELGWAFPLHEKLKGYVQFFSGYGQSLIDYNSYQQSVGLGLLIDF